MPKSCDTMLNLKCNIQWNPMWHLFNYSVNQFKKAMYKIINNSKITADYWKKKKRLSTLVLDKWNYGWSLPLSCLIRFRIFSLWKMILLSLWQNIHFLKILQQRERNERMCPAIQHIHNKTWALVCVSESKRTFSLEI